jgi:hypothetical protein
MVLETQYPYEGIEMTGQDHFKAEVTCLGWTCSLGKLTIWIGPLKLAYHLDWLFKISLPSGLAL